LLVTFNTHAMETEITPLEKGIATMDIESKSTMDTEPYAEDIHKKTAPLIANHFSSRSKCNFNNCEFKNKKKNWKELLPQPGTQAQSADGLLKAEIVHKATEPETKYTTHLRITYQGNTTTFPFPPSNASPEEASGVIISDRRVWAFYDNAIHLFDRYGNHYYGIKPEKSDFITVIDDENSTNVILADNDTDFFEETDITPLKNSFTQADNRSIQDSQELDQLNNAFKAALEAKDPARIIPLADALRIKMKNIIPSFKDNNLDIEED